MNRATLILALLAAAVFETVRWPASPQPWCGAFDLLASLALAGLACGLRRPAARSLVVLALVAWPVAFEVTCRVLFAAGVAPEYVLLAIVRNLMFGLVHEPDPARRDDGPAALGNGLSLFLVVASLMFAETLHAGVPAAGYGLAGLWWLMGRSWDRLHGRFAEPSSRAGAQSSRKLPTAWRWGVLGTAVVLAVLAGFGAGGSKSTSAWAGFFLSSGGDRWHDSFAQGGVRDGDQLVGATKEAESFGPVESKLFMTDESPSLYDVASDLYGEACPKKNKEVTPAVGLSADDVLITEEHKARTQQSGREFSVVRRRSRPAPKLADRPSDALVYVQGRVPLHLRLETFDTFDGREWHRETEAPPARMFAVAKDNTPWIAIDRSESVPEPPVERHRLKVVRLDTARIPTPAHATAVRIDLVDRPEFFGWSADDVLFMPRRERVPALQVIHLESQAVEADRAFSTADTVPDGSDRIAQVARSWTRGVAPGRHVAAIVARLKADYVLDRDYRVPEACEDSVAEFLFVARRGPDYLFASAATRLLQSLGVPARVAVGLYANPARYERQGRQTPVFRDDLHVWTEVRVGRNVWATVDATPGYEVLPPPRSLAQRTWASVVGAGRWVVDRAELCIVLAALLSWAVAVRRTLLDRAAWCAWWLAQTLLPARRVEFTLRLLEWRMRLAGRPRPRGATFRRWYAHAALRPFVELATRALYRPATSEESAAARKVCAEVAGDWTWRRLAEKAVAE